MASPIMCALECQNTAFAAEQIFSNFFFILQTIQDLLIKYIFNINTKLNTHSQVLTLKMASAQVVKTSVANNSPSQDSNHPDDLFQSR